MDLRETAAEKRFRDEVRGFVQSKLPHDIRDKVLNFQSLEKNDIVRWHRILNAQGWGAPAWPKEYGGTGWTPLQRHIFDEECFLGGAPRYYSHVNMIGPVLQRFGTAAQKARFLPKIITMEEWWCQGYSEPGAGSDLASLNTRAERSGDKYIVNGQKIWTSYAHYADWMFCLVRTSATGKPQEGISFLLIDMKTPGITVRPIVGLNGGGDLNEVFFDNVEVPVGNLVHEENKGWSVAKYLLGFERAGHSFVGLCKLLLRRLKETAAAEKKHGKPLIDDPCFRHRIAQVEMNVLAHEWTLLRVLSLESARQAPGPVFSVLKVRGSELLQELSELLMECAGPYALPYLPAALSAGWQGELPCPLRVHMLAAHYFDRRSMTIRGGTTEVQKNIIAGMILGL
ncbi:MAG: acyl-CoA dehydrogenase family protein [Betaproteobacteria bacterium]|nr:acyl-CoA dehydrogenase family protein [Betaproteobacteria bacterium]